MSSDHHLAVVADADGPKSPLTLKAPPFTSTQKPQPPVSVGVLNKEMVQKDPDLGRVNRCMGKQDYGTYLGSINHSHAPWGDSMSGRNGLVSQLMLLSQIKRYMMRVDYVVRACHVLRYVQVC